MIHNLALLVEKLTIVTGLLSVAVAQIPTKEFIIVPPPPAFETQASIRNYIVQKAIEHGVSSTKALYIVEKESGFGFRNGKFNPAIEGPEKVGSSWGIWQFWDQNDGFNKDCAIDPICSTELAMQWLKSGKENRWSTWRMRKDWYKDQM